VAHPLKPQGLSLYREGWTIRQIADELGVSYNTVQTWVSTAGIARKPGPRRRS
jgi:transposase